MIAVHPKEDCPHVEEHVSATVATNLSVTKPCGKCQGTIENWICCKCGEIGCSRFQKSHMSQHNAESQHQIAASFSDFSFWCYACDSYIKHPLLVPILDAMGRSKFPQPEKNEDKPKEDKEAGKVTDAMANLNIQQEDKKEDKKEDKGDKKEDKKEEPEKVEEPPKPEPILKSLDIEGIADFILAGKAKNIIVMTGAGVSVAAGIPDFRTPGTGLYYNLAKYNLPHPTAVFEIDYFQEKPQAFYVLAKELYPGNFVPTHVHYFIRLLHEKGLLLRNYTQNIDTLERIANVPPEKLVEAHGSFGTSHCLDCKEEYPSDYVKDAVFSDKIPRCTKCNGLVKPDIVFFGESLPTRFFSLLQQDFPQCDLLIVIGTSLQVQPFASLVKKVPPTIPRLLINMEEVGTTSIMDIIMPSSSRGFAFNLANNVRDVKLLGECQAGVKKLAELLGWGKELDELYEREAKIILANSPLNKANSNSNSNAAPAKEEEPFRADPPATTATSSVASDPAQSTPEPAQTTPAPSEPAKPEPALQSTTPAAPAEPAKPESQTTTQPAQPAQPENQTTTQPAQPTPEPAKSEPQPTTPQPAGQTTTQPAQATPQPAAEQHST